MGTIIGLGLLGILVIFAGVEVVRYFRARLDPQSCLPYPRRRLSRRLAVAVIFGGLLVLTLFWPQGISALAQMGLLLLMLVAMGVGLVLLGWDFKETTRSVVEHAQHYNDQADQSLAGMFTRDKDGQLRVNHEALAENEPTASKSKKTQSGKG